ncbi:MAG: DNA-binding protein [Candidatus Altiarchaeota archaeon]
MQELLARQQSPGAQEQVQRQLQEAEVERQIHFIISRILSPEARERLGNIRVARPQFARQIEVLLIQLNQAGKLPDQLSDEQLKAILTSIKSQQQHETRISRK